MDEETLGYWQERWESGRLGFHMKQVNPWLARYLPKLNLRAGDDVLVPLCGKSLDMLYLQEQDFKVTGIELGKAAIEAFIEEHGLRVKKCSSGPFGEQYHMDNMRLYCGDIFSMPSSVWQGCHSIYDRAAYVALQAQDRRRYLGHVYRPFGKKLSALLLTLDYPPGVFDGPPYSVDPELLADELSTIGSQCHWLNRKNIIDKEPGFKDRGLTQLWSNACLVSSQ